MKYNHAMAEREYKREWKAAKLEMRKAGMQRKQIREAARAYRLEFNGERRFYRRIDVVPACEREATQRGGYAFSRKSFDAFT